MNIELSKRQRGVVRQLNATVHERAMRKLLNPLADEFARWRAGATDTWTLLRDLDRFNVHRKRLSQRHETASIAPMLVAHALVAGLLREDEVPKEVLDAIGRAIAFYRQGLADGTVSMEEED